MTLTPSEKNGDSHQAPKHRQQHTEDRLTLALERAASADRWRSHVESLALIHRQRALQVERNMDHVRRQAGRLQYHVDQLNHELHKRDTDIAALGTQTRALNREVDAKNHQIADLESQIARMETQIVGMAAHIAALDAEIVALIEAAHAPLSLIEYLRRSPLAPSLRRIKRILVGLRGLTGKPASLGESDPQDGLASNADEPDSTTVLTEEQPHATSPVSGDEPDSAAVLSADGSASLDPVSGDESEPAGPVSVDEPGSSSPVFENEPDPETTSAADERNATEALPDNVLVVEPEALPSHAMAHWVFDKGRAADSTKPTLLFITAEAADTAFGRHTLGVVHALARYANVLVWQLGVGPLLPQFQAVATGFLSDPESGQNYDVARRVIEHLSEQAGPIDCAVAVGLASRSTLPGLASAYLPTLLLIDDDAVYVDSIYTWQEVLFWSTHTLFTTSQARQQVLKICSYLNPANVSVLPPASPYREPVPPPGHDEAETLLNYRLQIQGPQDAEHIVVAWGAPDYASGLDAFVACADLLRQRQPDSSFRFVWLAPPGDASGDTAQAFTVKQNIERWGLTNYVTVIYAPIPVSVALSVADLVIFPARTDVLEHHIVDALHHGIPVVAFENATAVAHSMDKNGFGDECLVRYADVNALADRTAALLHNPGHRTTLGQQLASADWSAITSDAYAQALLKRCTSAALQVGQERLDEALIESSGRLQPDYVGEIIQHHTETQDCSDARLYVKGWNVGLGARKPRPGFHPGIYAAMHPEVSYPQDPFAAYLGSGSPDGPWCYPVIVSESTASPAAETAPARVALHIHAYYPDMLPEFIDRIRLNTCRPDLFISVRDTEAQTAANQMLDDYEGRVIAVEVVSNLGRDIGPFLSTFGQRLIDGDYELIGHVHTKRSSHADRLAVDRWRNFMLENVLGGEQGGPMLDTIVRQMHQNQHWGIAFPDDPLPVAWDGNRDCAHVLAQQMGVNALPDQFSFPAGNMFWIRPAALQPFVALDLRYDDYPPEPLPIDGTFLHALERLFGVVPRALGMDCALISVPGLSR